MTTSSTPSAAAAMRRADAVGEPCREPVRRAARSRARPLVLHGRLGHKQRASTIARLADRSDGDPILLLATASFVGEGLDCPPLDTVFLAFPLAWKGSVVQYVGRVMRASEGKQNVEVHDYVDVRIPVVRRMHEKRLVGYNVLGFDVPRSRRGRAKRAART